MATNTTNLSLIKPAGTDKVRIAQINQNMDLIDAAIGAVGSTSLQAQISAIGSGLAITSVGNTHVAITSGQYVYIRNHSSLSDGLYKATSNISANGTLSTSNVSSLSSGGANDLKSRIDSLNSQIANGTIAGGGTAISSGTDLNTITTPGTYYSASQTITQSLSNCPYSYGGFRLLVVGVTNAATTIYQFLFPNSSSLYKVWMRYMYSDRTTIGAWEEICASGKETVETPTQPTYTNVVDTSYTNRIYVKKCGRIVAFGGEFKSNGIISRNATTIATGCPPALSNSLGQFTGFYGTSPYVTQFDVDSNGNFATFYGTDIPSGIVVRFGTTYITSE